MIGMLLYNWNILGTLDSQTPIWHHPGGKLVERGAESLTQDELLSILIGTGAPGRSAESVAKAVLDEYGGLYQVLRMGTLEKLAQIPGLGPKKVKRILATLQLGHRLHEAQKNRNQPPGNQDQVQESLFHHETDPTESQSEFPFDAELLAEIIGSGTEGHDSKRIALDLLDRFGSLQGLYGQDLGKFQEVSGLGSVKIIRIAAALEIAKRIAHALS